MGASAPHPCDTGRARRGRPGSGLLLLLGIARVPDQRAMHVVQHVDDIAKCLIGLTRDVVRDITRISVVWVMRSSAAGGDAGTQRNS